MPDYDIDTCAIKFSKHFRNKHMRMWNWDAFDVREAIRDAHNIEKVGKHKYEAYARKGESKKIIFVYDNEERTIFIISEAEGK